MRVALGQEIVGILKGLVGQAAFSPCQIPGCDKHAVSNRIRCETCRRQLCLSHALLRLPRGIPTEAPIVCVSCIIDENADLLEE